LIEEAALSRFIDEADRSQGTLLPERIDEYISEENPVRVIDAFAAFAAAMISSADTAT
jgi:hypothetical protein